MLGWIDGQLNGENLDKYVNKQMVADRWTDAYMDR